MLSMEEGKPLLPLSPSLSLSLPLSPSLSLHLACRDSASVAPQHCTTSRSKKTECIRSVVVVVDVVVCRVSALPRRLPCDWSCPHSGGSYPRHLGTLLLHLRNDNRHTARHTLPPLPGAFLFPYLHATDVRYHNLQLTDEFGRCHWITFVQSMKLLPTGRKSSFYVLFYGCLVSPKE